MDKQQYIVISSFPKYDKGTIVSDDGTFTPDELNNKEFFKPYDPNAPWQPVKGDKVQMPNEFFQFQEEIYDDTNYRHQTLFASGWVYKTVQAANDLSVKIAPILQSQPKDTPDQ